MGLIQLLAHKDINTISKYFISTDGKTPLSMTDTLPKSSSFSYVPYSTGLKESGTTNTTEDKPLITPRSESSHCHTRSSSENKPSPISLNKNWCLYSIKENHPFIHFNKPFLPPLESTLNRNWSPNFKSLPLTAADTNPGF